MICHDMTPFNADCQTFKELFVRDGIALHLEINSANYALFIGRNEQLFAVVETEHFAYVITKLSKVERNLGVDNLDLIEDGIALSDVKNDPSFEMVSENHYWLSYEFKFRGHNYTHGQYLDHEGQHIIRCLDTKKKNPSSLRMTRWKILQIPKVTTFMAVVITFQMMRNGRASLENTSRAESLTN